jgi:lysozyme
MVLVSVVGALTAFAAFRFGKREAEMFNFSGEQYRKKIQEFLVKEEGVRNRVYKDSAGIDTIGIGHKILPGEERLKSVTLTPKQIEDLFFLDVVKAENSIKENIQVPLTPGQQAALISFVFNVGSSAFKKSTLLKLINEKRFTEASLEFPRWSFITINGQKQRSPGLMARRLREQQLFKS